MNQVLDERCVQKPNSDSNIDRRFYMKAFLKLTSCSGFKFRINNLIMYSRGVRFAGQDCNNYKLYCNCTNDNKLKRVLALGTIYVCAAIFQV